MDIQEITRAWSNLLILEAGNVSIGKGEADGLGPHNKEQSPRHWIISRFLSVHTALRASPTVLVSGIEPLTRYSHALSLGVSDCDHIWK